MHSRLAVKDLDWAELVIIKFCQGQIFSEEIGNLEKGKHINISSNLHKLCPQLKDVILRVGGHLSRLAMPVEVKHCKILARDLHISELLLRHQEVGHGGCKHMLSKLREKYWITGFSVAIITVQIHYLLSSKCSASLSANGRLAT